MGIAEVILGALAVIFGFFIFRKDRTRSRILEDYDKVRDATERAERSRDTSLAIIEEIERQIKEERREARAASADDAADRLRERFGSDDNGD